VVFRIVGPRERIRGLGPWLVESPASSAQEAAEPRLSVPVFATKETAPLFRCPQPAKLPTGGVKSAGEGVKMGDTIAIPRRREQVANERARLHSARLLRHGAIRADPPGEWAKVFREGIPKWTGEPLLATVAGRRISTSALPAACPKGQSRPPVDRETSRAPASLPVRNGRRAGYRTQADQATVKIASGVRSSDPRFPIARGSPLTSSSSNRRTSSASRRASASTSKASGACPARCGSPGASAGSSEHAPPWYRILLQPRTPRAPALPGH
jgi:hypothetical protein